MSLSHASEPASRWQPLSGGTAVWIFMAVEGVTFGMFLLAHAWGWHSSPESHAAGQALLDARSAAIGTVLLLLGSGLAFHSVIAETDQRSTATVWSLLGAAMCGAAFSIHKVAEYMAPELAAVHLSTSSFWFSYLFLTGLHLLHVVAGVGLFCWAAWVVARRPPRSQPAPFVATVATYWHLVDAIWLLLFPIVYLMHP